MHAFICLDQAKLINHTPIMMIYDNSRIGELQKVKLYVLTYIRTFKIVCINLMLKFERVHGYVPANTALCAENSLPPRYSVTSLNEDLSNRTPRSSLSLHSGTLTGVQLD